MRISGAIQVLEELLTENQSTEEENNDNLGEKQPLYAQSESIQPPL